MHLNRYTKSFTSTSLPMNLIIIVFIEDAEVLM